MYIQSSEPELTAVEAARSSALWSDDDDEIEELRRHADAGSSPSHALQRKRERQDLMMLLDGGKNPSSPERSTSPSEDSSSNSSWSPTPSSPTSPSSSPPESPAESHVDRKRYSPGMPFVPDLGGVPRAASLEPMDPELEHRSESPPPPQIMNESPWMCVFDLDSICGGGRADAVDTNEWICGISKPMPSGEGLQQMLTGFANPRELQSQEDVSSALTEKGDIKQVYHSGVFPYVMDYFSFDGDHACGGSELDLESRWSGHLPLADFCASEACQFDPDPFQSQNVSSRLRRQRPSNNPRERKRIDRENRIRRRQQQDPDNNPYCYYPREPVESPLSPRHSLLATPDSLEVVYRPLQEDQAAAVKSAAGGRRTSTSIPPGTIPAGPAAAGAPKDAPGAAKARKGAEGQVSVQTLGADRSALKELGALRDAPPAKREELFIMKLQLCSVIFTFDDPTADKRGKDMKRQTLLELVDYVNTPAGQKIFTESIMGDLMSMVSANVCRALPPATDDFDPEEDEPVLEPAWPHLQVAYEFFLRFIVSSEVNAKAAKKYVDQKFCLQLVELFDSEDPRERDYLKTILHRIYGKFMSHRSFIRRAISNVFYRFVYETERHNGIGELLEILGSIINGFAIPLKKEHLQFLVRALIPLHKPKCVALYHQQLSYCIIQYVEKDADTATPILNGFFKCWPWSCSGKQVMFLNELEEILELLGADQLAQVSTMLFTNLARCLDSDHFQVVERALFLWNNEHLVNSGCLSRLNAHTVLPIIYGPLYKNSSGHWNATVEGLAQNVLKMYMEYDLALYDKCTAAYFREEEEAKKRLEALNEKWAAIEKIAVTKQPALLAN